ncbi:hypothetical protein AJ87_43990 [Rhizobium yanglingense]|nr:hypothetical protein AJ87_43990 [Rhizobium yanglingense]
MAPKPLGVMRIEPHCFTDPFYPLFGPPEPRQQLALLNHHQVIIWIEGKRALLVIPRCGQGIIVHVHRCQNSVDVGVVVIQRQRPIQRGNDLIPHCILVFAPAVDPGLAQNARPPRMGMGITCVERDGPVYKQLRLLIVRHSALVMQYLGGKRALVCGHIRWFCSCKLVALGCFDATGQSRHYRARYLVLYREYVVKLPIVFVRPNMSIADCIDELDGHTHPVAYLANTSLHQVLSPKLLRDFAYVHGRFL